MYNDKNIIFCVSGFSKSGKDEFAKTLIDEFGVTKMGLTDMPRRHMMEIYKFSPDQMFGSASIKNKGDLRYPKQIFEYLNIKKYDSEAEELFGIKSTRENLYYYVGSHNKFYSEEFYKSSTTYDYYETGKFIHGREQLLFFIEEGDPNFWLSPREVAQSNFTNLQNMYENVWVQNFVELAADYMNRSYYDPDTFDKPCHVTIPEYKPSDGFVSSPEIWNHGPSIICTDIRHKHDIRYIRQNAKKLNYVPVMIRIKRPEYDKPAYDHRTETEQATIPDDIFDYVVDNDKSVYDLHNQAHSIFNNVRSGMFMPKLGILP